MVEVEATTFESSPPALPFDAAAAAAAGALAVVMFEAGAPASRRGSPLCGDDCVVPIVTMRDRRR